MTLTGDGTSDHAGNPSELSERVVRLVEEFQGRYNVETIDRLMADTELTLLTQSTVSKWLPVLIERLTRDRLRAMTRIDSPTDGVLSVLFLCVHNSGRSQMAAGWLRALAGSRVEVYTGGSEPSDDLDDEVVRAMQAVGIDIADEYPKPWTDEVVQVADVIVTMGCGEACPVLPGKRYEDWDLADPAGRSFDDVCVIRDDVRRRVEGLMHQLEI